MDPSTGAILADYSNPTFDPNALANPNIAAEREAGYAYFDQKDAEGIYPGVPLATGDTFPPGSTFKVVTSTAVYNLDPALTNFDFPSAGSTKLPNSNLPLTNDGGQVCGGTMVTMLPESCDPGYGLLGIALGAPILSKQAELFGYNSRPPVDLPEDWVATPTFPACVRRLPAEPGVPRVLRNRTVQREGQRPFKRPRRCRHRKPRNRDEAVPRSAGHRRCRSHGLDDEARRLDDGGDPASCCQCHFPHGVGRHERNRRWCWILTVTRCGSKDRNRTDGQPSSQHRRLDDRLRTGERPQDRRGRGGPSAAVRWNRRGHRWPDHEGHAECGCGTSGRRLITGENPDAGLPA